MLLLPKRQKELRQLFTAYDGEKVRKISHVKQKLIVTLAILMYALVLRVLSVPCVFKWISGFKCPGCGMTRAVLAVMRGEVKAALSFHWMVWSLPVLYFCFLYDGRPFKSKTLNILLYAVVITGFAANWIFNTSV